MSPTPIASTPRRAALAALMAAATLALAACAALQPKTPEQVVTERVEQRWAALIKGDFDKAWDYTQPGFKAVVQKADYRKRFGAAGQWKGVQVHEVKCEAERCSARLRLTTAVLLPQYKGMEINGFIDETWVREDGQWWYYQAI